MGLDLITILHRLGDTVGEGGDKALALIIPEYLRLIFGDHA